MPALLTSRVIAEVQQCIAQMAPSQGLDVDQLSSFAKEVLGSVDVRDLSRVPPPQLAEQFAGLLAVARVRAKREVLIDVVPAPDHEGVVVSTVVDDQPFLVSTIRALTLAEHLDMRAFIHAIVRVRRDPRGALTAVGSGPAESIMRVELVGWTGSAEELVARLRQRMQLVQAMVADFQAMGEQINDVADGLFAAATDARAEDAGRLREAEALLRWLADEHFVILSTESYDPEGRLISALGTSRVHAPARDEPALVACARGEGRIVRYLRSAEDSPVHRPGKPGYFVVPRFDPSGRRSGSFAIHGLFTYKALHSPPEQVPTVRTALQEFLADREVKASSHRGKGITNAFNSIPLEFLLSEARDDVWELTDRILRAETEGGSDVHIRVGEGGRFAFVIVTLPRWQFSEELRKQVQDMVLAALAGTYADYGVFIDRYDNAVLHYYVSGDGPLGQADTEALRRDVLVVARGWNERLREAIEQIVTGEAVDELYERYEDAFDDDHKRRPSIARLSGDIRCCEYILAGHDVDVDVYVSEFGDHPGSLNLRVFTRRPTNLSKLLPVVTHFGFEVIDEYSREVEIPHHGAIDMDNFRLDVRKDRIGAVLAKREPLIAAMQAVFQEQAGDDDLNRLIVASELGMREVEILRAYVAYLHQLQVPFALHLLRSTLVEHPHVSQAFIAYLTARFDPEHANAELARLTAAALSEELRGVTDYTADRVLKAFAEVVRATVRCNAWLVSPEKGQALAFKVASGLLSFGAEPRPFREIWVWHRDFEGVHLRGGKVARGGLRFSDRPDDFRVEIHGLMATQMVKNVLIVPMGAKGGFVLRHPPVDRDALRQAGDETYARFIRALLSITDNVVGGQMQRPAGVLLNGDPRLDEGEDPYLVVAADKGTAHLSDTANAISMAQGFWLDDAFASGGSNGYDHKKTGITARGAWEVTKRSFRELGVDPERDVIRVAGVGDMSGDVFGNGLLRSRTLKLVAAFNHVHIFVDPDPDPERSFRERERLFNLPRSAWTDYDAAALSPGGGVFHRKSKEVPLSIEARSLLGFGPDQVVNGDEVIRAILRLDVDLMWMGGIGTYVKARDESHADVGDKTNDDARVDANTLRCKVFAEGANLSITDAGRVEFARRGGQGYNAFLDNSGGVDTSDHEVNIKILFAPLLASGTVTRERRNELLVACEHDVVEAVLANNRSQSRLVSLDVARSRSDVHRYARTLDVLARKVPFDPDRFAMPSADELATRARKGEGLYKHEGAVLASHAKMLAYRELLANGPMDPRLAARLVRRYFPPAILEAVGDAVDAHLLGREIATTMLVNEIVDNAGACLFVEIGEATGRTTLEIAHAYMSAVAAGEVDTLLQRLHALEDAANQRAVYAAIGAIQAELEDLTYYLLDRSVWLGGAATFGAFGDDEAAACRELLARVREILPASSFAAHEGRVEGLVALGLDEPLARQIARLHYLHHVIDANAIAHELGRPAFDVLGLRLAVGDATLLGRVQHALSEVPLSSPWDGQAVKALGRQLNFHQHKMVHLVEGDDVEAMVRRYRLDRLRDRVAEQLEAGLTIPALVMLDDQLRRLLPALVEFRRGAR
jgi:glutamate dehydrogenase